MSKAEQHSGANKRTTSSRPVPEIVEDESYRLVIDARTDSLQTLRELGPPDIAYLVKQSNKSSRQSGAYHHVTGIDASSSASLAAYINTLIYSTQDKSNRIISGVYCCYNAFSRLDMRVQVKIPGTVESYCVNERGEQLEASEEHWLETYLCAVLRAYSYADSGDGEAIRRVIGLRRYNPIVNTEGEHKFLDAAERLYFKGWSLGSDPEVQVPNMVSNHLATGLLAYVKTTGRYVSALNLFEKLRTREPEIASLLAQVHISGDEEVRAVGLLHDALQELPMDYSLLACQASFLAHKGRSDLAVEIARRGVVAAPSEFCTWARLAEIYVQLERWDLALLTLNSCPMFTYQDKDAPKLPEPLRVHLPIISDAQCDELDDAGVGPDMMNVPPALRRLGAANYKGTFHKAYMILTEMSKRIGWDQLLKIRSQVFVMEEEYRSERQPPAPTRDVRSSSNASTTALAATDSPAAHDATRTLSEGAASPTTAQSDHAVDDAGINPADRSDVDSPAISRPSQSVTADPSPTSPTQSLDERLDPPAPPPKNPLDSNDDSYAQLRHKRLCERWLDNLFMVLYEDLRIYTIWRTESAQSRQQQTAYRKTADEWEILGALAERLHHPEEALDAWNACLDARFSPRAMKGVLDHCESQGDTNGMLDALLRLIAWQCRWYSEFSPDLLRTVRQLIEDEGGLKVTYYIRSTRLPTHVQDLTLQYVDLCREFRSSGTET